MTQCVPRSPPQSDRWVRVGHTKASAESPLTVYHIEAVDTLNIAVDHRVIEVTSQNPACFHRETVEASAIPVGTIQRQGNGFRLVVRNESIHFGDYHSRPVVRLQNVLQDVEILEVEVNTQKIHIGILGWFKIQELYYILFRRELEGNYYYY